MNILKGVFKFKNQSQISKAGGSSNSKAIRKFDKISNKMRVRVKNKKQKDFFLVKATEYALSIAEDKLNLQIDYEFEANIPSDRPVLFVANHFTRAETLIMPYVIKKYTGELTRTLADKGLFKTPFLKDFLTKAKVISTGNEYRDDIIIQDLLIGKERWMIYPEGQMTKDKNVFVIDEGDIAVSAKTGAAVIALKTEILRQKILNNQITLNCNKSCMFNECDIILSPSNVCHKPLVIIPISITYHPLNFQENWLESLIKKPLKKTSARLDDEFRVETSDITNSKIDLCFGKPIEVLDFVKKYSGFSFNSINPLSSLDFIPNIVSDIASGIGVINKTSNEELNKKEQSVLGYDLSKNEKELIKKARYPLSAKMMKEVYDNVLITPQHFYAVLTMFCVENNIDEISLLDFKNILTIVYFKISKRFDKFCRFDEYENEFNFLESDVFDKTTKISIKQGLIKLQDSKIVFNKDIIEKDFDFHQIRIKNTLRILYNEISYFFHIKTQIEIEMQKYFQKDSLQQDFVKKANQEIIEKLCEVDIENFETDYATFFDSEETKSKKITSPFFLPAQDGSNEIGIVLSHGYKSAPEEMRLLAEYLSKNNISVYVVRLKGHGTGSENMKYITHQDWLKSVKIGYEVIARHCQKVFLCGFSTGGLLSIASTYNILSNEIFDKKIDGIVCINAALRIADIKFKFIRFAKLGIDLINHFRSKDNLVKEYVVDSPENPHINYSKNYLNGLNELAKLIDYCDNVLDKISIPTLVIQGDEDPVVNPSSGDLIFNNISSVDKDIYKPHRHRHVIVRGAGSEEIFLKIRQWILQINNKAK